VYRALFVLVVISSLFAHASVCPQSATVCSSFEANSIVFRGRVLEAKVPASPAISHTYPDGSTGVSFAVPMSVQVRFEVLEVFKGEPGREITMGAGQGMFKKDGEYVVFASPYKAAMVTSVCSRTHPITDAAQDADLMWLRAYPAAPATAAIFGSFAVAGGGNEKTAASVTLSGDVTRTAIVDEKNGYRFSDLAPGTYTVTASVPAGLVTEGAKTVSVGAKGCAEVDWYVQHDSHIRGTVSDASGQSLSKVRVGLLRPASNRTGFDIVTQQGTDERGGYDFSKVEPGDYWVALYPLGPNNNEPHAPVYYPTGSTSATAKLLHVTASESLADLNLVAPEALHPVVVKVQVLREDGSAVNQALVIAKDTLTPTQAITATADSSGRAEITLYVGRVYKLVANTPGTREPACAGPVQFVAKDGLVLDAMTLDKSFHDCRALQNSN
jgi:hypothetical protein